ncbi:MAG: hypothetical protein R2864_14930 [Syntrophotaleaceae bacterium]
MVVGVMLFFDMFGLVTGYLYRLLPLPAELIFRLFALTVISPC